MKAKERVAHGPTVCQRLYHEYQDPAAHVDNRVTQRGDQPIPRTVSGQDPDGADANRQQKRAQADQIAQAFDGKMHQKPVGRRLESVKTQKSAKSEAQNP